MAFIYKIVRLGTDQCYVGHTSHEPAKRWWGHQSLLRRNIHPAPYLQNLWNNEGLPAFGFEVVEECLDEDKVVREQYWMDNLNSCFNAAPAAGSRLGYKLTDEQLARQWYMDPEKSKAAGLKRRGQKRTPEQRQRFSVAQQNNPLAGQHRLGFKESDEARERRLALARAGKAENPLVWITDGKNNEWHPEAEEVPEGWRLGRTFAEEHKAAAMAASSGPRSAEVRANIKAGHADIWDDPEKRQRMMENRRPFNWFTDGTRAKRVAIDEVPPEGWVQGRGPRKTA